ncbi:MAG: outer membrane protein transport protein [Pseudomonadota bacterium]
MSCSVSASAFAGGYALREQSTTSQGAAFAGSAAGGSLSSMFWNPAALGAIDGTVSESHAAGFFGRTNLAADGGTLNAAAAVTNASPFSGDIADEALITSSYYGHRLSERWWLGLSINAPFGLVTEPANQSWQGAPIARKSEIFTLNAAPTAAVELMPGVVLGAGLQVQYLSAELSFATAPTAGAPSAIYKGDDIAIGGTLGIYLTPSPTTQIGIGYRSEIRHTLDGDLGLVGGSAFPENDVALTTPDTVTVSVRHALSPRLRVMGTFEWTNWSDFDAVTLTDLTGIGLAPGATATIDAGWDDAWFASVGAEYDVSDALTVRGGVGFERSPIRNAEQRLTSVPDADRIWLSAGASYAATRYATIDVAYTRVLVDDARFSRSTATDPSATLEGSVETNVDIFSLSVRQKLNRDHPVFGGLFR